MKKLILKWLGIDKFNDRICKLEAFEHISELHFKRIDNIDEKLNIVYENISFDANSVLEKYKYIPFNKIPNYVHDIFLKTYKNIQFKDSGADTIIYYNDKFVGYTQYYFGQVLESINAKGE